MYVFAENLIWKYICDILVVMANRVLQMMATVSKLTLTSSWLVRWWISSRCWKGKWNKGWSFFAETKRQRKECKCKYGDGEKVREDNSKVLLCKYASAGDKERQKLNYFSIKICLFLWGTRINIWKLIKYKCKLWSKMQISNRQKKEYTLANWYVPPSVSEAGGKNHWTNIPIFFPFCLYLYEDKPACLIKQNIHK